MSDLLLSMQSVVKRFPGKNALDHLNFRLAPGQVVGLLGRNGAGKTTMIECALGLRDIDAGGITLFGADPEGMNDDARSRIGYVPQQSDLFEWLTAGQMLAFFRSFYPRWNDEKVTALLDRWSISPAARIGHLSMGEKQRLSIIRALAHEPELLILDEPVASLDPAGRRDFLRELMDRAIDRNTTVLFSTHILTDLERVVGDVAFMRAGQIVLEAPLDLLADETHRLVGPAALLADGRFNGELARDEASGTTSLLVRLAEDEHHLLDALRAQSVRIERVGLEDLFIEVTR